MKDMMIDIETMGTNYDAAIVQIGACFFDRETGEVGEKFSINIDIQSCLDNGLQVSGKTLEFWFNQERENRTFLKRSDGSLIFDLKQSLLRLKDFIEKNKSEKLYVWSHATFDIPILVNAYKIFGMSPPFFYRNTRDIRTLMDLSKNEKTEERKGIYHDALDDCIFQVEYCYNALRSLK